MGKISLKKQKKKSAGRRGLLWLVTVMLELFLAGCGSDGNTVETKPVVEAVSFDGISSVEGITVLTDSFSVYDWTSNIVKGSDKVSVSFFPADGADLHSYEPTVADIAAIKEADLMIFIGGESDEWVKDVLEGEDTAYLNVMECLGGRVIPEEIKEGMQAEDEDPQGGSAMSSTEAEDEEKDEHVWLSLYNAVTVSGRITEELEKLDPENSELYYANLLEYTAKLEKLDSSYREVCENAGRKLVVVADRYPFRYLFDDYGIDYYAAFPGCSSETDAGFETIAFLSAKVNENNIKTLITIEGSDNAVAKKVAENANADDIKILTMDSLQSVSSEEVAQGKTYIGIMEKNLEALRTAMD